MNRAPAPVPSIEETSLNRLWAAPKLPRLSFNQLAVSGCTVAVPPDQLGRWRAGRQLRHTHLCAEPNCRELPWTLWERGEEHIGAIRLDGFMDRSVCRRAYW